MMIRLKRFALWLVAKLWDNAPVFYSVEFVDQLGRPHEVTTNLHRARCLMIEGRERGERVKIARYARCGYVREGDLR